jgi:hypothetical protein
VWSQAELTAVNPSRSEWLDMFTVIGGVPVFCDEDRNEFYCRMNEIGCNIGMKLLTEARTAGTDDYVLIHMIPSNATGWYCYMSLEKSFASQEVCRS